MWRWHLFELEDFSWFPKVLREGQTDYLRFMMHLFGVYKSLIPKLGSVLSKTENKQLIDLCSGGGGSMLLVDQYLQEQKIATNGITLSDLYPNLHSFNYLKKMSKGRIDFEKESVNALNIPDHLNGVRTFFNSFHHLKPEQGLAVLQAVVDKNLPICVFEPMEKSILQLITNLFATSILCFLCTPFIKPFRWNRIFFTYIIPLIPIVTTWDGIVSVARLYSPKHLQHLISQLSDNDYYWETGHASHTFGKTTYLVGYPK